MIFEFFYQDIPSTEWIENGQDDYGFSQGNDPQEDQERAFDSQTQHHRKTEGQSPDHDLKEGGRAPGKGEGSGKISGNSRSNKRGPQRRPRPGHQGARSQESYSASSRPNRSGGRPRRPYASSNRGESLTKFTPADGTRGQDKVMPMVPLPPITGRGHDETSLALLKAQGVLAPDARRSFDKSGGPSKSFGQESSEKGGRRDGTDHQDRPRKPLPGGRHGAKSKPIQGRPGYQGQSAGNSRGSHGRSSPYHRVGSKGQEIEGHQEQNPQTLRHNRELKDGQGLKDVRYGRQTRPWQHHEGTKDRPRSWRHSDVSWHRFDKDHNPLEADGDNPAFSSSLEYQGPARFLTFEGGEGVGKSTQARLLARKIKAAGIPVLLTREPGGTPFGEAVRQAFLHSPDLDPTEEMLLILAARRYHVNKVIKPALAQGTWVICDRFTDSTRVYQGLAKSEDHQATQELGQGGSSQAESSVENAPSDPKEVKSAQDLVAWINQWHDQVGIDLQPDRTFVLQGVVEQALARRTRRAETCNKFDYAEKTFHDNVQQGFSQLIEWYPERCINIQSGPSLMAVHHIIWDHLYENFLQPYLVSKEHKNPDSGPTVLE